MLTETVRTPWLGSTKKPYIYEKDILAVFDWFKNFTFKLFYPIYMLLEKYFNHYPHSKEHERLDSIISLD
jgi:hypothetical protein